MVCAGAEVAYQREFRSRWNKDFLYEMALAEDAGPQHLEAFFEKLSRLPISHDVHFDLEESNSESRHLQLAILLLPIWTAGLTQMGS